MEEWIYSLSIGLGSTKTHKCWSLNPKTMRILIPFNKFLLLAWFPNPIPRVVIPDPGRRSLIPALFMSFYPVSEELSLRNCLENSSLWPGIIKGRRRISERANPFFERTVQVTGEIRCGEISRNHGWKISTEDRCQTAFTDDSKQRPCKRGKRTIWHHKYTNQGQQDTHLL